MAFTQPSALYWANDQAAGIVPDYSGGSVPDSHRIPYYARKGHHQVARFVIKIIDQRSLLSSFFSHPGKHSFTQMFRLTDRHVVRSAHGRHIGSFLSHLRSLLRSSCDREPCGPTGFGGSRPRNSAIAAQFQLMTPQGFSKMKTPLTEPYSWKTSVKAIRMQREREYEGRPKGYRHTYKVSK